jgi:hypothetical protein
VADYLEGKVGKWRSQSRQVEIFCPSVTVKNHPALLSLPDSLDRQCLILAVE